MGSGNQPLQTLHGLCFSSVTGHTVLNLWVSYLMQLWGSVSQSILHMNLSQCNQPMVGVSARPLSSASAAGLIETTSASRNVSLSMFALCEHRWLAKTVCPS